MQRLISSHCLLIALGIAALVTSIFHIDRLQQRIENLEHENASLKEEVRIHEQREQRDKEAPAWVKEAMEMLRHN
jgi:hypothetical protein